MHMPLSQGNARPPIRSDSTESAHSSAADEDLLTDVQASPAGNLDVCGLFEMPSPDTDQRESLEDMTSQAEEQGRDDTPRAEEDMSIGDVGGSWEARDTDDAVDGAPRTEVSSPEGGDSSQMREEEVSRGAKGMKDAFLKRLKKRHGG